MRVYLLLALFILFGCIGQQAIDLNQNEKLHSSSEFDIDGDTQNDVFVLSFAPVTYPDAGFRIERKLIAYREIELEYTSSSQLNDNEIIELTQDFDQFRKSVEISTDACMNDVGLVRFACVDAITCSKLCSASSSTCKKLVEDHEIAIGESVLRYSQSAIGESEILSAIARTLVAMLNNGQTNMPYLQDKFGDSISNLYSIEASPLVQYPDLKLCKPGSYLSSKLQSVLAKLGNSTMSTKNYHYVQLLRVIPDKTSKPFSQNEMTLHDRLPAAIANEENIASAFQFSSSRNGSSLVISFPSIKEITKKDNVVIYSFSSSSPPEDVAQQLKSPSATIQVINLESLGIISGLFDFINSAAGNPYIAFSLSVAFVITTILLSYFIITLLYNIGRAKLAKEKAIEGIRKTLRRTTMLWKSDILFAAILLFIGFGTAILFSPKITKSVDIFDMGAVTFSDPAAFINFASLLFGSILVYLAVENRIKIFLLEDVYGQHIRGNKDIFLANIAQLKDNLDKLRELTKTLARENFDLSAEYNELSALSEERVASLASTFDEPTMQVVQKHLVKVSDTLERLQEKKKTAEANWPQWKLIIDKLVEENEKVHASQLLTIPTPLRTWALSRFVLEYNSPDVTFEGELIRRKKLSPEHIVQKLFDGGLLVAIVAIKDGNVILAKTAGSSNAVAAALALKLIGYAKTLIRNLNYSNYSSLASVGNSNVLIVAKDFNMETLLIVPRERFKQALDAWKEKAKHFAQ